MTPDGAWRLTTVTPRRVAELLVSIVVLVVVGVTAYWAGTNAVLPPELPLTSHLFQTYVVATGTVGRSMRVQVTASWPTTRTIFVAADGVVTSVAHLPGSEATAGQVVATIDLEPLVVAEGSIPMFRALREGVVGADVAQFQRLLITGGFMSGHVTGRFQVATAAAAKRWQRSVGAQVTGVVLPNSLLFVEHLPQRLVILPTAGQSVNAGSDFAHVLVDTPEFAVTMAESTRSELATGMSVDIAAPGGGTWTGRLGTFTPTGDGRYAAEIEGPVCGNQCDEVAVAGETNFSGSIVSVPEVKGIVVPDSALVRQPSGGVAVVLSDGVAQGVRIVAEADGFAIIDGLEQGTIIRLPAAPSP